MKKLLFAPLMLVAVLVFAQAPYKVSIDLTAEKNDQVPVTIEVPKQSAASVTYNMARVVPGTYSISNFGRFVNNFRALDKKGNLLPVVPVKSEDGVTNQWKINNATKLAKITYWVDDTFDENDAYFENIIFEPAGTSIEADKGVYVINTFGMVGYLSEAKDNPYELTITYPQGLYGATSLTRKSTGGNKDVFSARNFHFLADGPIMYSRPDTVSQKIAGAKVLVSVYSPNKKVKATDVMDNIYDLMVAQSNYLGGKLPVDRYTYLIYLMDYPSLSGAMGALEHSYSSFYTLPEEEPEDLAQSIRDVAAHEFFHVVTPLTIHSEQIHYFDFINPKMSKHLWLYEGVTEYSSMHVQVKYGLYDLDTFLEGVREKLTVNDQFPPYVPFTEMSERVLEPDYKDLYVNVYYKGAVIGMCLDAYILKYSNGQKDLQWVLRELSKSYGIDKPFKDDELFDVIEKLTSAEIGEFLRNYVSGSLPLPVQRVLGWAGIDYEEEFTMKRITLGNIGLALNKDQDIFISDASQVNEFGQAMGYKNGDVLRSLNGKEISIITVQSIFEDFAKNTKEDDMIRMTVSRDGKEVELKAPAMMAEVPQRHRIEVSESATEEQLKFRKAWLGN
jgi:predicted metalloprotease with PDZ domain